MELKPSITGGEWHPPSCFGCGKENPHGLSAGFNFDEETGEVRFVYTPKGFESGAPEHFHGGILATLLDESQGVLCFHIGHMVMTDRLYMKYHHAVPISSPLKIRCWVTAVRKRRVYTRGTAHGPGGELYVSSSAVWYLLPERVVRKLIYRDQHAEDLEKIKQIIELNRKRARDIRRRLRETRHSAPPSSLPPEN